MKRLMLLLLAASTVLCMSACIGKTTPSDVSVNPNESSAVSDSVSSDLSKSESDEAIEDSLENASSEPVSNEVSEDHSHNHGEETPSQKPNEETPSQKPNEEKPSQKPEEKSTAPINMVGTWKRVSVETEGDVTGGGNCTVVITGTSESNLKISYTDKNFPSENYSNKTIDITEQKYFDLFGNGDWCAAVNHSGPNDTIYCLALFEGDVLKIKTFFDFDGGLGTSLQVFERVK